MMPETMVPSFSLSKELWASSSCINELIVTVVGTTAAYSKASGFRLGSVRNRGLRVGLSDKPVGVSRLTPA